MVLVDTSVWVWHLRQGNERLAELLELGRVAGHPFVIGELACGNLKNRSTILALLQALPQVPAAENDEILRFIENHRLMGRGIGFIDIHLLAAASLAAVPIWTLDNKLRHAAAKLGLAITPSR